MVKKDAVILGGGLSGLVVADYLQCRGYNVTVVEKDSSVGGMCKSKKRINEIGQVVYDLGPHKFATRELDALMYYMTYCMDSNSVPIRSSVYISGNRLRYPPSILQIFMRMPMRGIMCAVDFVTKVFSRDGDTYEKYLIKRVGRYTYGLVFRDYADKIWDDPKTLDAELAKKRVVVPTIVGLLKNLITGKNSMTFNSFYYNDLGSGIFPFRIAKKIEMDGGRILTSSYPVGFDGNILKVSKPEGDEIFTGCTVISTIPYNDLIDVMGVDPSLSDGLSFKDLNLFYFLIKRPCGDFDTWSFFPDAHVPFTRMSRNFANIKDGYTLVCLESTEDVKIEFMWSYFSKMFGIGYDELVDSWTDSIKGAYPLYSLGFKENVDGVLGKLEENGRGRLFCLGRNACHNYNNMDHTIIEALRLGKIIADCGGINTWINERDDFDWRIVD